MTMVILFSLSGFLQDWQGYTAPAIVVVAGILLLRRWLRSRKSGGACSKGCGCDAKKWKAQSHIDPSDSRSDASEDSPRDGLGE